MLALQKLKEYAATDRTAIIHRGLRLSYRELDFLCCALGALKSGRAYVPIEHSVPAERAGGILQARYLPEA